MSASRSDRSRRSLTFIGTLLLSTALAAPAFAQIEEVIVTAQKRAEDIQTVPIAMSAFSAQDLAAHQIVKFSDLQFAAPNVTYSQGNFGGANFQIRGLGITAVGGGSESAISVNFADVYLAAPPTDGATFYDLQDVEVLRGPQSTLYGRGASGGAVSIMPNRPDLDTASAQLDFDYGNYNAVEVKGDVNLPIITDQLGLRIAGDFLRHSGYTENIADDFHQNDRNQYSVRGSLRWEPTSSTTIDVIGQFTNEDDARGRADKELCAPDPTGVLGCTPAAPQTGALNLNATYLNILAGKQGYEGLLAGGLAFQTLGNPASPTPGTAAGALALDPPGEAQLGAFETAALSGGNVPALLAAMPPGLATSVIQGYYGGGFNTGYGLGSALGLTDSTVPFVAPAGSNPSNMRQVNDDFDPINKQQDNFLSGEWKQKLTPWLDSTFVAAYDHGSYLNEQSYTNTFGPELNPPSNPANLATAEFVFLNDVVGNPAFGGSPALAANYEQFFAHTGELPVSNFTGLGISSGSVNRYSPNLSSNDEAQGTGQQESLELRFNSSFSGPLNFLLGGFWLHTTSVASYYVASNSLDYASILAGGIGTVINGATPLESPLGCLATGCLDGPSYYHNIGYDSLDSKSIYGEVRYDVIPDTFKLTGGLRYTIDDKAQEDRIAVLSGLVPIGATNESSVLSAEAEACQISDSNVVPPVCGFDPNHPNQPYIDQSVEFRNWSGHLTADWTPKLDFTDQTLIYASYSRGYKAGGFNPGVQAGISSLPLTYAPELIDAYEIGTKNILLDGHLQLNGDIWYYNYNGLQVSAIIDNTSINENINAKLWGAEGQFVWLPTDNLQFDLNVSPTHSGVTGTREVDERNPTGGDPRAILIKDNSLTSSANQNCVIYDLNPGPVTLPAGYTFVPSAVGPQLANFSAPPGGQTALASSGVANAAFGSCSTSPQLQAFLAAQGYSESDPNYAGSSFTGVPVNLNGNELQQTPSMSMSVGAQYTFNLDGGFTLVPRVDYYWQTHMWGRIFEDPADLIKSWDVANVQLRLNAPEGAWYVAAYVKNVFNKTYVDGEYLTSSSSGLYTNAFLGDPRLYGIQAGIRF